jgi:hypothetical protein
MDNPDTLATLDENKQANKNNKNKKQTRKQKNTTQKN